MRTFSIVGFLLLTGFLIVPAFDLAAAQQPTEAERDAIRSACRSDFVTHCASVQPGGKEALECLLQNDSKLSQPCKSAVNAVAPKPEPVTREAAPAAPEPPVAGTPKPVSEQTRDEQIKAVRQACTLDDFVAHCSWIQPSSPEVVLCLEANAAALSPPCQTAVGSLSTMPTPTSSEPGRQETAGAAAKKTGTCARKCTAFDCSHERCWRARETDGQTDKRDTSGLSFRFRIALFWRAAGRG